MTDSTHFELVNNLYMLPTASGAYYAVSDSQPNPSQKFLQMLMQQKQTPALNAENLQTFTERHSQKQAFELLHHCQNLKWIQGSKETQAPPEGTLEEILPELLKNLSTTSKILLADEQGFYMANHGFAHETAEELSALSAEISSIHSRRSGVLNKNLSISSHAWAIVNAYGHSQIGFWPLFIGSHRFVIVNAGIPHFNHPNFVQLIWLLSVRYAAT